MGEHPVGERDFREEVGARAGGPVYSGFKFTETDGSAPSASTSIE